MIKNKLKEKAVITKKDRNNTNEINAESEKQCGGEIESEDFISEEVTVTENNQSDMALRNLNGLIRTISSLIAERAAKHYVEITRIAGMENMGRVLSLMEECEPYVNVLILESVFATCGNTWGVEDMDFLYWCVENAPGLFAEFKEAFMTTETIDDLIVEIFRRGKQFG